MTKEEALRNCLLFAVQNVPRRCLRTDLATLGEDWLFESISFHWGAGWADDVSLRLHQDGDHCLSWSSTHRTVAQAQSAIALYAQAAEFAVLFESFRAYQFSHMKKEKG